MKECGYLIYNPKANGGKATGIENRLKTLAEKCLPGSIFIRTEHHDRFWSRINERLKEADWVIACGGDGTVHQICNQIAGRNITLGAIPIGNGNDFSEMLGMPSIPEECMHIFKRGKTKAIDLIKCQGDLNCWCINTLGMGLDGLANRYTQSYKQHFGSAAYILGAIKSALVSRPAEMIMKLDGHLSRTRLLMLTVCNGFREGGRFIVATDARLDDGYMDILKLNPMNKLQLLISLPRFIHRFPQHFSKAGIQKSKVADLDFKKPVAIHVDGEYSKKNIQHLRLKCIPKVQKVFIP